MQYKVGMKKTEEGYLIRAPGLSGYPGTWPFRLLVSMKNRLRGFRKY